MIEQKLLPTKKIRIIADYRERKIIELLEKKNVEIVKINLPVGDFVCGDGSIGIERKSHSDLVSSIIDGRVFRQVDELLKNYSKVILIIEGFSERKINENALMAAIAFLSLKNISLIFTRNEKETANMIYWIAKKIQNENSKTSGFKVVKKKKNLKELQEQIVSSLPKVRGVLAKRLLKHFGSVENVFKASEHQLKKVKGIGEKLAKEIKKVITAKYEK